MVKYNVISGQRKVVATITGCSGDAINLIRKRSGGLLDVDEAESFRMKNKYTASAICHAEDVFDVEVGKKLALERVLIKYNKDLYACLQELENIGDIIADTLDGCMGDMNSRWAREDAMREANHKATHPEE